MRQVLIISNQAGREWTDRLTLHLKSLRLLEPIRVRAVEHEEGGPGAEALAAEAGQAAVCLLLFPAHLLNSYPKETDVLPRLLREAVGRGALVLRLAVSAASYKESLIQRYLNDLIPSQPLYTLPAEGWSGVLNEVGVHVRNFLHGVPVPAPLTLTASPERAAEQPRASDAAPAPATPPPAAAGKSHTFVCYAREDAGFVLSLASELKRGGAHVWLDQWDIPSGADWEREIDRALYDCRHFLIVLSPAAVESEEVRGELRTALDGRKRVVPVIYRPCSVPRRLRLLQHVDCTVADSGPGEEAVRLLLDALGR
ncbi:MAG TPA: toll/interleukin-1 receptor domain-containing protein [Pyrinomonadaceae bacterium]|nr:toll/interleukin-1 receptor domain-containing protein [Pyrinomonadaceae bacterium]